MNLPNDDVITTASGTWTPSPSAGSFSVHNARYVRVGNLVHVSAWIFSSQGDPGSSYTQFTISGLPVTSVSVSNITSHIVGLGELYGASNINSGIMAWVTSNSSIIRFGSGRVRGYGASVEVDVSAGRPSFRHVSLEAIEGGANNRRDIA